MALEPLVRFGSPYQDRSQFRLDRLRFGAFSQRGTGAWWQTITLLTVTLAMQVADAPRALSQVDAEPVLRLEADGPTSYVTSIAFSPDGRTLYAGSWDKTVYVWKWNQEARAFRLDPLATLRVPIGPGLDGAINTIAVSSDGNWVAAAGTAPMRGAADFRRPGQIIPTVGGLSSEMRQDAGTVYLFNTSTGQTYSLRGHRGEVRALTFAPAVDETPLLISAAREWNENAARHEGVVRVWKSLTADAPPLDHILPVPSGERAIWTTWPKLSARRIGDERNAIEVAIAWGDQIFRLWDVGRNQLLEAPQQGRFQDVVALQTPTGRFFSAAVGEDESLRLRAWTRSRDDRLQIDAASSVELPRTRDYRFTARGLAFSASAPGRRADVLCTVVHRNIVRDPAKDQYELWLYRTPFRGTSPRVIALWLTGPPPRRTPQMATSPTGEFLAVSREGEIYIYHVADVLAGNNRPTVLRNAGAAFDEIGFVRQGTADDSPLGLRLSEPRSPPAANGASAGKSHFIFDLTRGMLEPQADANGWSPASAARGDWRIDLQPAAAGTQPTSGQLVISQGGQRRAAIPLPAVYERSVFTLVAGTRPPLVALATYDNGLPALGLYDASTGQQIRQLTAHSARIRALTFSNDGQLLASVADDETVCLWRLTDLDRIVGRRGTARGVAVRQTGAGLVVHVDQGASASNLNEGDVLTARVTGAATVPWTSPREFYDAFWNATPGEVVRVRRRRANGSEDEVAIPVAQGVDERKPLLSLFFTRSQASQARGWIAWSPLGPYESSDRPVERYLGWHFNTGRPDAPVAFARAEEYREKYYRPGLVDALIKTGQPPEAKSANLPLPRPVLDVVIEGAEIVPESDAQEFLIRKPPEKVSLLVDNLTAEQIARIDLALDGKPLGSLQPGDDGATWSTTVDPGTWQPGAYRLKAILQTRESTPQQFAIERRVRYQAAPPQVAIDLAPVGLSGVNVEQGSLAFAASVAPGQLNEPMDVVLIQKQDGKEKVLKRWTTSERLEIKENIEVAEGGSQIEIVARNRNALPGFEAHEVERRQLAVNRHPAAPAPVVTRAQVEPVRDGKAGQPVEVGTEPRKVTVDRVRLSGEIAGVNETLAVESNLANESALMRISPFAEGRPAHFETEDIKLQPGLQTLVLKRKALGGPVVTTTIELDYRPPLPELVIERPAEPDQTLVAGRDSATVNVLARFRGGQPDASLKAAVLINGEPADVVPVIDHEARTIAAQVPLTANESNMDLKLWDAWNEGRTSHVARIRYLQLPSIDKIEPQNDHLPLVELRLEGQSASPVTRVEVGSDVLPASDTKFDAQAGRWQATARVPRRAATYEVAVQVYNRDGQALTPAKWQVPAWHPPEKPPVIELASGGNVTSANYELRFTVRSQSKLRAINIKLNRQPVAFDPRLAELQPHASGSYVFEAAVPLTLLSGDNRCEVLAANDGGAEAQQSIVNYIDPPARIAIDLVEAVGGPQKTRLPVIVTNRRAHVAGIAPTGKVLVRGRVYWPLSTDKSFLQRKQRLQLWVNGFQQAPGALEQPLKSNPTSEFTAFAVLNRKAGNHIQLALPDLTPDISTLVDFNVDCAQPVLEQRLHVLIVGVGAAHGDKTELQASVLAALQAKPLRDKLWRSAAFDQIATYGPVVGNDITPQQIRSQLSSIKLKIDELYQANRSSARPANDVVMIYLQGGALINVGDNFFVTTRPASDPRTSRAVSQLDARILFDVAVQSRTLANFLTHTTGAHVLMLDVTGNLDAEEAARWPEDSRAAMLRYTWLKRSETPAQARLLAALPEALKHAGNLAQLDIRFAEYNRTLANQFPQSTTYRRQVPEALENLLLGRLP